MKNVLSIVAALGIVTAVDIAIPAPAFANHGTVEFCKVVMDQAGGDLPS